MKLRSLLIGAALCAPLPLLAASNQLAPNSGDVELEGTGSMQLIITPSSGPTGGCTSGYSWNTTYGGCRRPVTETAVDTQACGTGMKGGPLQRTRTRTNYILQSNASDIANGSWSAWSEWTGTCQPDIAYPTAGWALDTHIFEASYFKTRVRDFVGGDRREPRCPHAFLQTVYRSTGSDNDTGPEEDDWFCAPDAYSAEMWFLRKYDGNRFENAAWEGMANDDQGGTAVIITNLFDNRAFYAGRQLEFKALVAGRGWPGFTSASAETFPVPHYYDSNGFLKINLSGARLASCHSAGNCNSYAGNRVGAMFGPINSTIKQDLSALTPMGCIFGDFYSNWNTNHRATTGTRLSLEEVKRQKVYWNVNTRWNENWGISDWKFPLDCYRQP